MLDVSINTKKNNSSVSYEKVGNTDDGRVIYETTNLKTNEKDKITVPQQNVDKFEKFVDEVGKFPYEKYGNSNKMVQNVYLGNVAGAVIGAGLSAFLTRNSSTTKRVLGVIGGSIGGLVVGAMASLLVVLSKITSNVVKLGKFSEGLDVKPYSPLQNAPENKETKFPEQVSKQNDAEKIEQKSEQKSEQKTA